MMILIFLTCLANKCVVEARLIDDKYECFDCRQTIENNKTTELIGGPCLKPSLYTEPRTNRMEKGKYYYLNTI